MMGSVIQLKTKTGKTFTNTEQSKAETKAALAKGQTKAKTAKTPASKQKLAAKIKEARKTKTRLTTPGELARCRAIAGGDIRAGMLLYRIAHLWRSINPKLQRQGREWLAMSREDWAVSAGLSFSELTKYALPRLRSHGFGVVDVQAMGRGKDKKIWINLDVAGYQEALQKEGYELKIAAQNDTSLYT